jgi:hypothetical protein
MKLSYEKLNCNDRGKYMAVRGELGKQKNKELGWWLVHMGAIFHGVA